MSTWMTLSKLAAQWLDVDQLRIMQPLTVRFCLGTMRLFGLTTKQER